MSSLRRVSVSNELLKQHIFRNFVINKTTGVILTNSLLDYEKKPIIDLTVRASDNGLPQKSDTCQVTVYLRDTNDNYPQFDQKVYIGMY